MSQEASYATPAGSVRGAARKTRAHTAAQLQEALGLSAVQLGMARAGGVIPAPDMKTPRWSGPVVDDLVACREQLLAAVPDYATRTEVMTGLAVTSGDWRRADEAGLIGAGGLIPAPDRGDFWSRPVLEEILARVEQIRAAIPPQPVGARRCAELLAERSALPVEACDIDELDELGLTTIVDCSLLNHRVDTGRAIGGARWDGVCIGYQSDG